MLPVAMIVLVASLTQAPTAPAPQTPAVDRAAAPDASKAMAAAASELLAALPAEQRTKATRPFDDPQRTAWSYLPGARTGLFLSEMSEAQKALTMKLIESALSADGVERIRLTRACEITRNAPATYGADLYAILIFGDPADATKPWGWRFEGHHIGLHFSSLAGETTTTPLFFGAFPASLVSGPDKGKRPLGAVQDAALALRRKLSPEQAAMAKVGVGAPADVITGPGREASFRDAATQGGIAMPDLTAEERDLLWALVVRHASDLRGDLASDELRRIKAAGTERIRFGWAGEPDLAKPHYYRIAGPTFVIEFDCTQNDPNHVHCVWNDPDRNFGDVLKAHLANDHGATQPTK